MIAIEDRTFPVLMIPLYKKLAVLSVPFSSTDAGTEVKNPEENYLRRTLRYHAGY